MPPVLFAVSTTNMPPHIASHKHTQVNVQFATDFSFSFQMYINLCYTE